VTLLPIEKRIRLSGLLIVSGLVVLLVSLLWAHPLAFLAYLVIGCPLMVGGALLYLYSLASKDVVTLVLMLLLAGCSNSGGVNLPTKEKAEPATPSSSSSLPSYDPATATARISGSVNFDGKAPEQRALSVGGDELCKKNAVNIFKDKSLVTTDGKVRNVIIYVRSGYEGKSYAPPLEPVVIDQQGCVYSPHVLTVMKGQKLRIRNSDSTFHNVHAVDGERTEFNIGQGKAGVEDVRTFSRAVMPFKIGCDMHRWMSAYAGVFEHPFHTTSGGSGKYEMNLPPGKYEVVAWHEELGEQASTVEVSDKGAVELNFKFKGRSRG
jgi:plastocyanin